MQTFTKHAGGKMKTKIIPLDYRFWDFVRHLRNELARGFIQQKYVSIKAHEVYNEEQFSGLLYHG